MATPIKPKQEDKKPEDKTTPHIGEDGRLHHLDESGAEADCPHKEGGASSFMPKGITGFELGDDFWGKFNGEGPSFMSLILKFVELLKQEDGKSSAVKEKIKDPGAEDILNSPQAMKGLEQLSDNPKASEGLQRLLDDDKTNQITSQPGMASAFYRVLTSPTALKDMKGLLSNKEATTGFKRLIDDKNLAEVLEKNPELAKEFEEVFHDPNAMKGLTAMLANEQSVDKILEQAQIMNAQTPSQFANNADSFKNTIHDLMAQNTEQAQPKADAPDLTVAP